MTHPEPRAWELGPGKEEPWSHENGSEMGPLFTFADVMDPLEPFPGISLNLSHVDLGDETQTTYITQQMTIGCVL